MIEFPNLDFSKYRFDIKVQKTTNGDVVTGLSIDMVNDETLEVLQLTEEPLTADRGVYFLDHNSDDYSMYKTGFYTLKDHTTTGYIDQVMYHSMPIITKYPMSIGSGGILPENYFSIYSINPLSVLLSWFGGSVPFYISTDFYNSWNLSPTGFILPAFSDELLLFIDSTASYYPDRDNPTSAVSAWCVSSGTDIFYDVSDNPFSMIPDAPADSNIKDIDICPTGLTHPGDQAGLAVTYNQGGASLPFPTAIKSPIVTLETIHADIPASSDNVGVLYCGYNMGSLSPILETPYDNFGMWLIVDNHDGTYDKVELFFIEINQSAGASVTGEETSGSI